MNLSLILHRWVCVATIVVSLIKDRLSPKKAPPTIIATTASVDSPSSGASPKATGVNAAIVPTEVPIANETMQVEMKSPGRINDIGNKESWNLQ